MLHCHVTVELIASFCISVGQILQNWLFLTRLMQVILVRKFKKVMNICISLNNDFLLLLLLNSGEKTQRVLYTPVLTSRNLQPGSAGLEYSAKPSQFGSPGWVWQKIQKPLISYEGCLYSFYSGWRVLDHYEHNLPDCLKWPQKGCLHNSEG